MTKQYRVTWEIDIEADTPKQAAMTAKWYQQHGDWSSVFDVSIPGDEPVQVDLDEICTKEDWQKINDGGYPPKFLSEEEIEAMQHCDHKDRHTWIEYDGNGIPLCKVCYLCAEAKLSRYRPEILRPYTQADVDEPIEEDY